jgi:hypothetical protein
MPTGTATLNVKRKRLLHKLNSNEKEITEIEKKPSLTAYQRSLKEIIELKDEHSSIINQLLEEDEPDVDDILKNEDTFITKFYELRNRIDHSIDGIKSEDAVQTAAAVHVKLVTCQSFKENYDKSTCSVNLLRAQLADVSDLRSQYLDAVQQFRIDTNTEAGKKQYEDHLRKEETFMNAFHELTSWFKDEIEKRTPMVAAAGKSSNKAQAKYAKIEIPKYDGSYINWTRFYGLFKSLVADSDLDDIVKFTHLEKALESIPDVLRGFSADGAQFNAAWEAVVKRYNDKRKILTAHLKLVFNVKKMSTQNESELRRIIDTFSNNLKAVGQMGFEVTDEDDFANLVVNHFVTESLDDETLKEWRKFNTCDTATWSMMCEFLTAQCRSLADINPTPSTKCTESRPFPKKSTFVGNSSSSLKCNFCGECHIIHNCSRFADLNVMSRNNFVKSKKLCDNCLSAKHSVKQCQSKSRCRQCNGHHNTLLHRDTTASSGHSSGNSGGSSGMSSSAAEFRPFLNQQKTFTGFATNGSATCKAANAMYFSCKRSILTTAIVHVQDVNGDYQECRALIDGGSDTSYISSDLVKTLRLPTSKIFMTVEGIDAKPTIIREGTRTQISSLYGNFVKDVEFAILPRVTGNLPSSRIDRDEVNIPIEYFLADPTFNQSQPVDMLLGNLVDNAIKMKGSKIVNLQDELTLNETKLGWTISGAIASGSNTRHSSTAVSSSTFLSSFAISKVKDEELNSTLERFFQVEDVDSSPKLSPNERYCEELFKSSTTRGEDGKFIVRMPFKPNIVELGNNLKNATRQFYAQENCRNKDEKLKKMYNAYMKDLIDAGHMEEINPNVDGPAYYLPHHGVVKLTSTTTKVRPVFNASSKSESGLSLNDTLFVGPMVQPESFDILMRLREKPFVIMGDIEKMFLQIWVHPDDCKFLRVLWRTDANQPLKHFQMKALTFGTASAPHQATSCVREVGISNEQEFPDEAEIIKNCTYVDDSAFGVDTIEKGVEILNNIRGLFAKHGMRFRKIVANNENLLSDIPEEDREATAVGDYNFKTLGMGFDANRDEFFYKLKPKINERMTKASVLGEIASIYDPIGWIGPVVLEAKKFMKKLWLLNIDWKDELPTELRDEWQNFRDSFVTLNSLRIQRHCYINAPVRVELHGFSDASEAAYGAAIYARSIDTAGNIQVSLLCSKSRVAPKHKKTLARLELCGATLLSMLVARIAKLLKMPLDAVYLWSDSTIVLFWIKMQPARLNTFVGNRVAVIQEHTEMFNGWAHVKGIMNPADLISRGMVPDEIASSSLWWNGPTFLKQPRSEWPKSIVPHSEDDVQVVEEMRHTKISVRTETMFKYIETHERPKETIRVFAIMLRFMNAINKKKLIKTSGPLTVEEREAAEIAVIKVVQKNLFAQEYRTLWRQKITKVEQQVHRQSSIISLTPFIDDDGLIRVGGRLDANTTLTNDQKHQIILPGCHFSNAIVRDLHIRHMHPGQLMLLSIIRQRFWPMSAKVIINRVTKQCIKCIRIKEKAPSQLMADLPLHRVNMKPPFTATCVDYTGYYLIKSGITRNAPLKKCYMCMFKCMVTGAIHLELVTELSTDAFIAALDRFVSRRGLCSDMFSDNGTNFQGCDNEFKSFVENASEEIADYLAESSIKWHFTTARAPHAGGIYESGIKSAKHYLKRILTEKPMPYEQLSTILCKVEAMLNSRPITPMSNDPNDLRALTPGHFLTLRPLIAKPERNFLDTNSNRLIMWNIVQKMQQEFWKQWHQDYLHTLQQRPKGFQEKFSFKIGNMVLIKDSFTPPLKWKLGRITKFYPGKDGVIRNVQVRTATGYLDRHVKYLCFLPPEDDDNEAGECVGRTSQD